MTAKDTSTATLTAATAALEMWRCLAHSATVQQTMMNRPTNDKYA